MLLGLLALVLFALGVKSFFGDGIPVTYKITIRGPIAKVVGVVFFLLGLATVGFLIHIQTLGR